MIIRKNPRVEIVEAADAQGNSFANGVRVEGSRVLSRREARAYAAALNAAADLMEAGDMLPAVQSSPI